MCFLVRVTISGFWCVSLRIPNLCRRGAVVKGVEHISTIVLVNI